MPKRSLNPDNNNEKKIDQLNRAVDAMLARTNSRSPRVAAEIAPLARIAAELRDLPRESFKEKLKAQLLNPQPPPGAPKKEKRQGRKTMTPVAEPTAATRTSATPRLAFRDPAKAIEFYQRALGAKEVLRFQVGNDIPHAELKIGDSTIDITGEWPEGGRFSAETLGNSPISMSIEVPDVDAFADHAVDEGMKLVIAPKDQFYGHRDATLRDPFGYTWGVFTVTEEMSVDEMHRRMGGLTQGPEGGRAKPATGAGQPPRGFFTVTPYIVTADGDGMIDFAKNAFDAEIVMRATGDGGGVHGEVRIGDTMLMMGGGVAGKPFHAKPQLTALHVYVKDADAAYKKALEAGATSISAPQDHDYGERGASVKDPFGNFWYIATHIAKKSGESYMPKGLHNVNVYLHPRRAEPVIGFLKRAFGAQELSKHASPDGVVHHAEIRVGDAVIEMGEAHGVYEPMPSMFYVYVPDADAAYRRAIAAGAKSLHEVQDQPYGDRNGAVTDPFGNIWYVATHVRDAGA